MIIIKAEERYNNKKENITNSSSCIPNPCLNGFCISNNNSNNFQCFCLDGFTGQICEHNFDECLPGRNPCQNSTNDKHHFFNNFS